MWRSDGTGAGTIAMSPLNNDGGWAGGSLSPYDIYATSFGMFMIYTNPTTGSELYIYNGTSTGFENISDENSVKVYPNPANNILNIELTNKMLAEDIKYTIMDMQGRIIVSKNIKPEHSNFNINVSEIQKGIYTLQLNSKTQSSVLKFSKF